MFEKAINALSTCRSLGRKKPGRRPPKVRRGCQGPAFEKSKDLAALRGFRGVVYRPGNLMG